MNRRDVLAATAQEFPEIRNAKADFLLEPAGHILNRLERIAVP